jgi:hypothetical protein
MDIDWRKEINKMRGPFPEVGIDAPEAETIKSNLPALDQEGDFSKMTTEVYFFVDNDSGKVYTMEKHWMTEFGEVPLKVALQYIKRVI